MIIINYSRLLILFFKGCVCLLPWWTPTYMSLLTNLNWPQFSICCSFKVLFCCSSCGWCRIFQVTWWSELGNSLGCTIFWLETLFLNIFRFWFITFFGHENPNILATNLILSVWVNIISQSFLFIHNSASGVTLTILNVKSLIAIKHTCDLFLNLSRRLTFIVTTFVILILFGLSPARLLFYLSLILRLTAVPNLVLTKTINSGGMNCFFRSQILSL